MGKERTGARSQKSDMKEKWSEEERERLRRQGEREEPVTLDERSSDCGLQLGMAGGRA